MTAEDYYTLVSTHDERKRESAIARIPSNINRAGKHYKKLIKQIYATH